MTGRVQIVEPQVAGDWNQEHSGDQGLEESSTNQAVVTPNIQETVRMVNPTQATSSHASIVNPSQAGSSHAAMVNPTQASSSHATSSDIAPHTTGVALGKRFRDDESFAPDESDSKRTRITSQQEHSIPTINVIDENQQVVTQIQPQSSVIGQPQGQVQPTRQPLSGSTVPTGTATPAVGIATVQSSDWHTDSTMQTPETQQTGDDVIMVLSDEDDGQGGDNDNFEDDEEEEDYDEDDDEDDEEDEEDEDIEEAEDGEDVVIIDMDEHQQQQSTVPPPLQSIPQGEGMQSAGRSQLGAQLTPFYQGSGNLFEDDDCTVPSTPTLSQPRRADGFAEALNSPAVAQRFVFGSNVDGSDLAELESQRALGMDDTRMDLSQFDEAGGRSAPSTPTPHTLQTATMTSDEGTLGDGTFPSSLETEMSLEQTDTQGTGDIEVEDDDDALDEFEGEHDEEEDVDDADAADSHDIGDSVEGASGDKDNTEYSQDKSESSVKPPIKKIVWDHSGASSTPGSAPPVATVGVMPIAPLLQTTQPIQQQRTIQRRAQGLRRGAPARGRGGQNWVQGQSRGSQRGRGWRGGSRGV